jgi:hypothetical protein
LYLSQRTDISEEYYPFLFKKKPDQVITIGLDQTEEEDREFLLSFVKLEQKYPIYIVMHVPDFMGDDVIHIMDPRNWTKKREMLSSNVCEKKTVFS